MYSCWYRRESVLERSSGKERSRCYKDVLLLIAAKKPDNSDSPWWPPYLGLPALYLFLNSDAVGLFKCVRVNKSIIEMNNNSDRGSAITWRIHPIHHPFFSPPSKEVFQPLGQEIYLLNANITDWHEPVARHIPKARTLCAGRAYAVSSVNLAKVVQILALAGSWRIDIHQFPTYHLLLSVWPDCQENYSIITINWLLWYLSFIRSTHVFGTWFGDVRRR